MSVMGAAETAHEYQGQRPMLAVALVDVFPEFREQPEYLLPDLTDGNLSVDLLFELPTR